MESLNELSTTDTRFLEISKDKLRAKYTGKGIHPHDGKLL